MYHNYFTENQTNVENFKNFETFTLREKCPNT